MKFFCSKCKVIIYRHKFYNAVKKAPFAVYDSIYKCTKQWYASQRNVNRFIAKFMNVCYIRPYFILYMVFRFERQLWRQ